MSLPLRTMGAAGAEQPLTGTVECPLCSRSTGRWSIGCRSCPMGRGCTSVTCPRCGYRFVPEDRWRARLERWAGWARRRGGPWT